MDNHHHPINWPSKYELYEYFQGSEETHLKIKFAVNVCQVLSIRNNRGHGLLSDRSHQKPVWLTPLLINAGTNYIAILATEGWVPTNERRQSKADDMGQQ
jgi:hypothetical protein